MAIDHAILLLRDMAVQVVHDFLNMHFPAFRGGALRIHCVCGSVRCGNPLEAFGRHPFAGRADVSEGISGFEVWTTCLWLGLRLDYAIL